MTQSNKERLNQRLIHRILLSYDFLHISFRKPFHANFQKNFLRSFGINIFHNQSKRLLFFDLEYIQLHNHFLITSQSQAFRVHDLDAEYCLMIWA